MSNNILPKSKFTSNLAEKMLSMIAEKQGISLEEAKSKLPLNLQGYVPSLDILKKRMLLRIDAWTANKITNGMVSSCVGYPVLYDTDRDTQDKLKLALGLVNAGVLQVRYPEGFPCRGYKQLEDGTFETEKTIHLVNAAAVIQWNTEFGEHLKKCTAEGWAKQAEVNACTTKEELEAVVL